MSMRETFTASASLALLRKTEDDNRLWKDSMRRVQKAIIIHDHGTLALEAYREKWQF